MKLSKLIAKLQKIQNEFDLDGKAQDPEVIIDADENGYYNVERVHTSRDMNETFVNIKSSNEC